MKAIPFLIEVVALGGVLSFLAFVNWTKIVLGAVLAALGAFYPRTSSDKATGQGVMGTGAAKISMAGSLRVGVILAGLALIVFESLRSNVDEMKYKDHAKNALSAAAAVTGSDVPNADQSGSAEKRRKYVRNSDSHASIFSTAPPTYKQKMEKLIKTRQHLVEMQAIKKELNVDQLIAAIDADITALDNEEKVRKVE